MLVLVQRKLLDGHSLSLSRSGASIEPRYSPLLRMMMTRQLRRLAGFLRLVREDTPPK
jgi:hypothetical protein